MFSKLFHEIIDTLGNPPLEVMTGIFSYSRVYRSHPSTRYFPYFRVYNAPTWTILEAIVLGDAYDEATAVLEYQRGTHKNSVKRQLGSFKPLERTQSLGPYSKQISVGHSQSKAV